MSDPYKERPSDSPFISHVEWGHASNTGARVFRADSHWYMFVQRHEGTARLGISGPISSVLNVLHPADMECFGIRFAAGTFMPMLSGVSCIDHVTFLPEASENRFWLDGAAWELPTFDNAETFVNRLIRAGLLIREPVIDAVLHNQPQAMSFSTLRRRFLRATGLTPGTARQIERARRAETLLKQGASILDVVHEAGYFDQPHLTRALKHFVGQTPAQVSRGAKSG